jgi:hypothetical protein
MKAGELEIVVSIKELPNCITMQVVEFDEQGNVKRIVYRSAEEIIALRDAFPDHPLFDPKAVICKEKLKGQ